MGRIGMGVVREDRDLAGGASRDSQSSYRRFVEEMTRLNLWYVHRLLSKGEIGPNDLPGALTSRVNIYRMTVLWDGLHDPKFGHVDPEWVQISRRLATLLSSTPSGETSIAEERGLHLLCPLLEWNDPDRLYQFIGGHPHQAYTAVGHFPSNGWASQIGRVDWGSSAIERTLRSAFARHSGCDRARPGTYCFISKTY
jgi:hypothetical protein